MIATTLPPRFAAQKPPYLPGTQPGGREPTLALAQVAVLVIEDEAMIAWVVESLLEDLGFTSIMLASNAAEAGEAAALQAPGLIVSDINLGVGKDGIEAVGAIRDICNPAVVFVSAYVDRTARQRIAERVPDACILAKPLSGEALSGAVLGVLELKQRRRS